MRITWLTLCMLSIVSSFPASADDLSRKDLSIGLSYGYQGLAIRKSLSNDTLVFVGAGYGRSNYESQIASSTASTSSSRSYTVSAGARLYLSEAALSDFVQLELYENYTHGDPNSSSRAYSAIAGYGFEYFLDSNVSVEARAGLSYSYSNSSYPGYSSSTRSNGIPTAGIALTRYW